MIRFVQLLLLCIPLLLAVGCARKVLPMILPPTTAPAGLITDRARTQSDLMNLADDFVTSVTDVYGEVESRASASPQKSLFVQSQKADIAQAALNNAVNPRPLAGMMDMLVLVTLTRIVSEEAWVRDILGTEDTESVLRMVRAQEETMWRVAGQYVAESQLAELRELITAWRAQNAQQRYIAQVRMVDFAQPAARTGQEGHRPNSILGLLFLDPLAGIDPAVREIEQSRDTAERMFFYAQRMPMVISWQMELLYRRMLTEPQLSQMLTDVTGFSDASKGFAQASTQFADSVESFRKQIPGEREQAIDQLGKLVAIERDAALRQATTQIATLRDGAIGQLNNAVSMQRDAIMTQATTRFSGERVAAIDQFMKSAQDDLVTTLRQSEETMKRSIDRFYAKMRNLSLLTIGAIFVMLVAYRLVTRSTQKQQV